MNKNKQLKNAYKQQQFRIGVFAIRNKVNGKIFIGSSVNLDAIWNRIHSELKFNGHRNELLQKEWNEFGGEHFSFEVLSEIKQEENERIDYAKEADKLEQMFLEELQPYGDKGYHTRKKNSCWAIADLRIINSSDHFCQLFYFFNGHGPIEIKVFENCISWKLCDAEL